MRGILLLCLIVGVLAFAVFTQVQVPLMVVSALQSDPSVPNFRDMQARVIEEQRRREEEADWRLPQSDRSYAYDRRSAGQEFEF